MNICILKVLHLLLLLYSQVINIVSGYKHNQTLDDQVTKAWKNTGSAKNISTSEIYLWKTKKQQKLPKFFKCR